jgi:hypothetical protein
MGDPDQESQQELFSRLGHDVQYPAVLAVIRTGWAANLRVTSGSQAFRRGTTAPLQGPGGGGVSPPCATTASMFVALAGLELALGTGMTPAPPQPVQSDDHFLAPAFVQIWCGSWQSTPSSGLSCGRQQ